MLCDTSSVDTHKYPTSYRSLLPSEPQAPPTELKAETKTTVRSFAMQTSKNWEMFLPTARGSEQIAADISLLTEMRLAQHQPSAPKVVGRRLLSRRGTRPTTLKKENHSPQPVKVIVLLVYLHACSFSYIE